MSANVLVVHGGGPTAVINASLYGVVEEAKSSGSIGRVYGAIGGSEGILKENFLDLMQVPEEKLSLLLQTPATAIGYPGMPGTGGTMMHGGNLQEAWDPVCAPERRKRDHGHLRPYL